MKREGQSEEAELTEVSLDALDADETDAAGSVAPGGAEMLLELVLAEHAARAEPPAAAPERIDGVVIGELAALGDAGEARVAFAGGPADGAPARAMAALGPGDVGREVALMFEGGDPRRPVIMGLMHVPGAATAKRPEARVDGERVELSAEKELVLRCGKASITLTRAGKILIRGAYLLARSSGVNRIQGGSVQIN
jgi:hypothetical protein